MEIKIVTSEAARFRPSLLKMNVSASSFYRFTVSMPAPKREVNLLRARKRANTRLPAHRTLTTRLGIWQLVMVAPRPMAEKIISDEQSLGSV